ncbi:hypothetical protein NP284_39150 [Rhodopseudomonas pseudopalustris]|uniref:hypothetical protein n=1 Tax=Rhodopseudomonas pseudopalustris TaxID=1513892 RepID=UPI003F980739
MPHDIVWLAHQLLGGEARGVQKGLVVIGDAPFGVGLRDDQTIVVELVFDIGDREVVTHPTSVLAACGLFDGCTAASIHVAPSHDNGNDQQRGSPIRSGHG